MEGFMEKAAFEPGLEGVKFDVWLSLGLENKGESMTRGGNMSVETDTSNQEFLSRTQVHDRGLQSRR